MKKGGNAVPMRWILGAAAVLVSFLIAPGFARNTAGDARKLTAQATQAQQPQQAQQSQQAQLAQLAATVYDAVLAGKSCKADEATQALTCEYKVGTGLHFLIEGIGQPDTGISFLKSSADEDFFGSFAVLHGCVIVSRGERGGAPANAPDFAFVSPKNGKVYGSWEECKEGL